MIEFDDTITLTKLNTQEGPLYLLIGWQLKSFETYIYQKDNVWKGKFSVNRMIGFSRNLQIPENEYFISLKRCLTQCREDYLYELKNGFFYWKRKLKNNVIIEGFLPVELEKSPNISRTDLIEISLALNRQLSDKVRYLNLQLKNINTEYQRCLKDTEEFLNLKIDVEKALCKKFFTLLNVKRNGVKLTPSKHSELIKLE